MTVQQIKQAVLTGISVLGMCSMTTTYSHSETTDSVLPDMAFIEKHKYDPDALFIGLYLKKYPYDHRNKIEHMTKFHIEQEYPAPQAKVLSCLSGTLFRKGSVDYDAPSVALHQKHEHDYRFMDVSQTLHMFSNSEDDDGGDAPNESFHMAMTSHTYVFDLPLIGYSLSSYSWGNGYLKLSLFVQSDMQETKQHLETYFKQPFRKQVTDGLDKNTFLGLKKSFMTKGNTYAKSHTVAISKVAPRITRIDCGIQGVDPEYIR